MATFGPVQVDQLIEVQAFCEGPGGSVFSDSVFISTDCNPTVPCAITSDTNSVTGPAGTSVNLAGSATGAFIYQENVELGVAGWVTKPPITQIEDGYFTRHWRICCVDNPAVCSTPQPIVQTFPAGTIHGTVRDQNGTVSGVQISLWTTVADVPQTVIATTSTSQYGGYSFPGLGDGTYAVQMTAPSGCTWTLNNSTTLFSDELTISGGNVVSFINGNLNCT